MDEAQLMLQAAQAFLAALQPEQRAQAMFPFEDRERFHWHFTPIPRRGLPMRDLTPAQRQLAHAFISSGYSGRGAIKATQIMSLEAVLQEIETAPRFVRDPDLYFISIFGEPSAAKTWGWRLEGHHVSLNITLADGQQVAVAPIFFGANPSDVLKGPRAGLRVLGREEDLAMELVNSLDGYQRELALLDPVAPDDLISYATVRAPNLGDEGVPAGALNQKQRGLLNALLEEYASTMISPIHAAWMQQVAETDPKALHFAWMGGTKHLTPHYYRVQAPRFLVEYDSTQGSGNHIHSVWRSYDSDFGRDVLGEHLREAHGVGAAAAD